MNNAYIQHMKKSFQYLLTLMAKEVLILFTKTAVPLSK